MLEGFPDVQCWVGWHFVHSLITVFFLVIFVIFCTIVALTYFEPRMTSANITARLNSQAEVGYITCKVASQAFFNFLQNGNGDNDWLFVIFGFLLALINWIGYQNDPYYNENVGKLYKILSS